MKLNAEHSCRVCKQNQLVKIHEFGEIPLADKLGVSKDDFVETSSLTLVFCENCFHLQVLETVNPEKLFKYNYPYYSSAIPEVVSHFKKAYQKITESFQLNPNDLIVEIAANDGVLLNQFKEITPHLISIEPSILQAEITNKLGIKTYNVFFNSENAQIIKNELTKTPRLILASNVLAHVPDPDDFVKGLSILMDDETTFILEVPHSLPMIQNHTFDVIFHQHYSYFNLKTLKYLFNKYGLHINSLEKVNTQGGSLRLYISKIVSSDYSVSEIFEEESKYNLHHTDTYKLFSKNIIKLKAQTLKLLEKINREGETVIGYGAPGKASNFLNYFGISKDNFKYLVDISPSKQHKFFPNTGLEIFPVEKLYEDNVDYIFILVWNYTESIMSNLKDLKDKGVKFIVCYPQLTTY